MDEGGPSVAALPNWQANGIAQDAIQSVSELAHLIRSWRVEESALNPGTPTIHPVPAGKLLSWNLGRKIGINRLW